MNYRIISALLGMVAVILGVCMFLCLPWGLPAFGGGDSEIRGAVGLLLGGGLSILLGVVFIILGRGADEERLFRKEAFVIVSLSWIMAIILGATPYLFSKTERASGVRMSFCDAIFESASGLTTTGATVIGELENPEVIPRTILFWRSTTHFLGGLGVICFFVVLLGQGINGKAILKIEHSVSGNLPAAQMRTLANYLFRIYALLNILCCVLLLICGMSLFDAISHAFSVVALGGFSTHDASVAYFASDPRANGLAIECVLILFMIASGTNYWLIFWAATGQPQKLYRDSEWRCFISLIVVGIAITTCFGMLHGDFRPASIVQQGTQTETEDLVDGQLNDEEASTRTLPRRPYETIDEDAERVRFPVALRRSAFQVVSLATGAGFVTDRYELWNSTSIAAIVFLMFIGGCAGSTAGGAKVFRVLFTSKLLSQRLSETFSPNVVRVIRVDGENIDKESLYSALTYVGVFNSLIAVTTLLVTSFEPNDLWILRGESQVEKVADLGAAAVSMFANVGPALGVFGSIENYGGLTEITKAIFAAATLLGRLEIWTVLALLSPNFWRNR